MKEKEVIAKDPILATVRIDEIEVGDRFRQEYGNLQELVLSFKKHGFFSVLALGQNPPGAEKPYRLLAGGRRLKACEMKGMETVNCCIYDRELSDLELRELELAENVHRKDLTWDENAALTFQINELYNAIHGKKTSTNPNAPGWTQAQTAEKMGKSVGAVSEALLLHQAIALYPELRKCKTATEAMKTIQNMGNNFVVAELAEKQRSIKAETPIAKQRNDLVNHYMVMDFFAGVAKIPDNSMDFIEIDPPYGIDLQDAKKVSDSSSLALQEYNDIEASQYQYFIRRVTREAYRVLKPTGWIVMWFAHEPWFETVYREMADCGFIGNRMVGMWQKQQGQNKRPELYLANTTEMFFYMRKSTGMIQKARINTFTYPAVSPNRKIHPTERPIEMIADLLRTFCLPGAKILVPFLGSGNTLLAAANENMQAMGFDLSQQYKDAYTVRVHNGEPGFYSSYPNMEGVAV